MGYLLLFSDATTYGDDWNAIAGVVKSFVAEEEVVWGEHELDFGDHMCNRVHICIYYISRWPQ